MTTTQLRTQMKQDCKHYTSEQILGLIDRIVEDGNRGALNASESITAIQVLEEELAMRKVS
jgi:hypothetical protein